MLRVSSRLYHIAQPPSDHHRKTGVPSVGLMGHTMEVLISREDSMTLVLTDPELVRGIYPRIKGIGSRIVCARRRVPFKSKQRARDEALEYEPGE